MASHVVVIDTSFRRVTVKVTPGKYLTDVLEEACTKFGVKSSNYGLKNNNKPIDISRTFRQTGLSSGAKLELVVASRTPTAVSVALQLPSSLESAVPGGRLTDKVSSNTTLWLILRKFESNGGANLNFTARGITHIESGNSGAGRIFYEMPTLNILGRELSTFGDLQKTLAQLGCNGGSCLIRLDFKRTEQPLEEAMAEIGQFFKEDAPTNPTPSDTSMEIDTVTNELAKLPDASLSKDVEIKTTGTSEATSTSQSKIETEPSTSEQESEIIGPGQRPILVYSAPSNLTPRAALTPFNDDDFEPTIAHAKLHQSRLQESSHNKRLLSDAETEQLEQERAAKLAKATQVSIKIRFPDQSSIVSSFKADETGAELYAFVAGVINTEDQPFKLGWTSKGPPQTVPKNEKRLIRDLGFETRMLVNFSWDESASEVARKFPILKAQYVQSAKEVPIPEVPVEEITEEVGPTTLDKGKGKEIDSREGKAKGIPKWFKMGGKK